MNITQKYIARFMRSGWEAFFEKRRPRRRLYAQSEYDYNKAVVDTAVQSQYSGNGDVNGVMWLLQ